MKDREISTEGDARVFDVSTGGVGPLHSGSVPSRGHAAVGFDAVRAAQVRAAGGAFLRRRPLVVWPTAMANLWMLSRASVPAGQWRVVAVGTLATAVLFSLEAWVLRTRALGEAWLARSLLATTVALSVACLATGGARSPVMPLLFAPTGVAFAAFGLDRAGRVQAAATLVLAVALAVLGGRVGYEAPSGPWGAAMYAVSAVGAMALLLLGVGALVEAYRHAGLVLERFNAGVLALADRRSAALEDSSARLAHEVKNPLAALKSLVQLSASTAASERERERLGVALGEVHRIEEALRRLLEGARPMGAVVSVEALLTRVHDELRGRAALAGVRLVVEVEPRSLAVRGDADALADALRNLGRNAIEASPRGGTVTFGAVPDRGDVLGLRLEVRDEGAGFAPAVRGRVGVPYVTTRAEGTGLGVALARAALAAHGGTLVYEPRVGGGTVAVCALARVE